MVSVIYLCKAYCKVKFLFVLLLFHSNMSPVPIFNVYSNRDWVFPNQGLCSRAIQCYSFIIPPEVSTSKLTRVIHLATRGLNPSIQVELAGEQFHTLHSCTSKQLLGMLTELTTSVFRLVCLLKFGWSP